MMTRFSTDIARGDVRHWKEMADPRSYQSIFAVLQHEKIPKVSALCRSGGGNVNRRCPDGHLLQFALPCGNGKKVETIDMVSPINPRFPATIDSPKNIMKIDDFYRAYFLRFLE
jgi:hypothetical protein